jgi:hypothetical protein
MHDPSAERDTNRWTLERLCLAQLEQAGQVEGHPKTADIGWLEGASGHVIGCVKLTPTRLRVVHMEGATLLKTVRMLQTCNARVGFSLRTRLMTDAAGPACLLIPNNRGQGCG